MTGPDLSDVRGMLSRSEEAAREGRRLIDLAVKFRAAAYTLIPPGARVVFDVMRSSGSFFMFERSSSGWVVLTPDRFGADGATEEWMREQWEMGNLRLLDGAE